MQQIDFIQKLSASTKRDYVARVTSHSKGECATIAKQFGKDYWDGGRQYGYGGYYYDGRWKAIAQDMIEHYGLKDGDSILDVGCGKGYLLHEFKQLLPNSKVAGIDISEYGIENSKEEIKDFVKVGNAKKLDFEDNSFDFVVSLGTLHNLKVNELFDALKEIQRVGKSDKKYIMVESYRNEYEKANLLYWQLTCESFYSPEEWKWVMQANGYEGDYGFIYFE
jgi:protein-L-isoaspartate(D-aspartate) O-methyltransferase